MKRNRMNRICLSRKYNCPAGKILIGRYKILVSLGANMAYGTHQSLSQSAGIFHNANLLEMVKIDIPISKGFIACGNETADFVRFVKRFSLYFTYC